MPEFTIKRRTIERAVFGAVIVVLLALTLFFWLRTPSCDANAPATTAVADGPTAVAAGETAGPTTATENATDDEPTAAAPTCTDSLKNQDETAADCGGAICHACANGKACVANADCTSGTCTANVCTAAAILSGKIDFFLKSVKHADGVNTSARLTEADISVTNGKATTANLRIEVYPKTSNDFYYLNQLMKDEIAGEEKPYATIALGPLPSGETVAQSFDLEGYYTKPEAKGILWSASERYRAGDDFSVEVRLIDADTDQTLVVAKKKITV